MRSVERRGDAQCRVEGEKEGDGGERERYRKEENRGGMMKFMGVKKSE